MPYHSLTLQEGKQYALPSTHPSFTIHNISLSCNVNDERTSVVLVTDDVPTILCNLIPQKIENCPFNLQIQNGTNVNLFVVGNNEVDILYFVEQENC